MKLVKKGKEGVFIWKREEINIFSLIDGFRFFNIWVIIGFYEM